MNRFSAFSLIATACIVSGCSGAAAATSDAVPADIQAIFDKPVYKNAQWGLRVLDGKTVLIDLQSQHQFFIGSVRKVFTIGQLLNAVGPTHTYDTPVYRDGNVQGGTLNGNLIIVASGDLTMGGRTNPDGSIAISNWDHNEAESLGNAILTKPDPLAGYEKLARAVKAAGIDRISGDVVIDDRLFQPFVFRDQFDVRPIFVNDDTVDLSIAPGAAGTAAMVTVRPLSAALAVRNELRIGAPDSKKTLTIDPELPACIGSAGCSSTIAGNVPSHFVPPLTGEPALVQTVRIVQPSNYARTVFVEALVAAGVGVTAPSVEPNPTSLLPATGSYAPAHRVAQLAGLPESDNAKYVMKISYNIGADTSLVLFGLTQHANSMDGALGAERKNLAEHYGIPASEYRFFDGSGGGNTTATNGAVTSMLDALQTSPAHAAFVDALPVLGVDGSLAFVTHFKSDSTLSGAAGNVRAKTGTYAAPNAAGTGIELKGQAFGGYIDTKSGRHLTYELVVNNVPISQIDDVVAVFEDEGTISAMLWRDF
jgi:D-alanyl-D-alanine carboxypeptidase